MASTSGEHTNPTAAEEAAAPDYEQRMVELLGQDKGPDAYQHLLGILALLDDVRDPPLSGPLKAYIRAKGLDPKLAVADGKGGFISAYNTEHAGQLRERIRLTQRAQLYQQVTEIGAAILRAPQ